MDEQSPQQTAPEVIINKVESPNEFSSSGILIEIGKQGESLQNLGQRLTTIQDDLKQQLAPIQSDLATIKAGLADVIFQSEEEQTDEEQTDEEQTDEETPAAIAIETTEVHLPAPESGDASPDSSVKSSDEKPAQSKPKVIAKRGTLKRLLLG